MLNFYGMGPEGYKNHIRTYISSVKGVNTAHFTDDQWSTIYCKISDPLL